MEGSKNFPDEDDDLDGDKLHLVENSPESFYSFNEGMKNDFNLFNEKAIHTAAYSYYQDGTLVLLD